MARRKGKGHWMQGAVKHPGAATASAQREGLSVSAWAQKHKHDSGKAGKRARLALIFKKTAKKAR